MTSARPFLLITLAAALGAGSGCTQAPKRPLLGRRTTVGSLKASVSELEFQREQLRREVADLKAENRRVEDRLAEEEEINGELTARLDDARSALKERGLDASVAGPVRPAAPEAPTKRAGRRGHKPPFARIPGQLEPADSADEVDDGFSEAPAARTRPDPGPQSRRDDPSQWKPVARRSFAPEAVTR